MSGRVLFLDAKDLMQYSHVSRHASVNYTILLQYLADYMNETTTWDRQGKVTTYSSPSGNYTLEVAQEAPNCV